MGELESIRNLYAGDRAGRKCELLRLLHPRAIGSVSQLRRLHALGSFLRAFPDNPAVLKAAKSLLRTWSERVRLLSPSQKEALIDTGMAGTITCFEHAYHTACQLADRFPEAIEINWDEYEEPDRLDTLLVHLVEQAEEPTFEDENGDITTQEWVKLAKGRRDESDLVWLLTQTRRSRALGRFAETLYEESQVPLVWRLGNTSAAITNNTFDTGRTVFRSTMRKPPARPSAEIAKPLRGIQLLSEKRGQAMIDVSVDALATRQREVFSMTHANANEVYLAPLGNGTHAAIMGVVPRQRFHLEGNYGYMLLASGRPIGYGAVSPLFLQGNTGINIFPEYRGGEAAFLFVQLLRAFHTLFGITRFVANPYQFGRGNSEAIKSGAFWFYYKIGFRPVDGGTSKLARSEYGKIVTKRGYRSAPATLRALAKSDFHLTLPSAKKSEYFDERWLTSCATGATTAIAAQPGVDRNAQVRRLMSSVAHSMGATSLKAWSAHERRVLMQLAPTIALAADLDRWSASQKKAIVSLVRAKAALRERDYVSRLGRHKRLRDSLAQSCLGR